MRTRALPVPLLREALQDLPETWSVTINKVGNLALLDERGEYTGWIDITANSVMDTLNVWSNE